MSEIHEQIMWTWFKMDATIYIILLVISLHCMRMKGFEKGQNDTTFCTNY